ncbi:MAG: hypothetical protein AAF518_13500 [Spirochaetota bacterium]
MFRNSNVAILLYILASLLPLTDISTEEIFSPSQTLYVTASALSAREKPNALAKKIIVIPYGTRVKAQVVGKSVRLGKLLAPWYWISSLQAFVYGAYLSHAKPSLKAKRALLYQRTIECKCSVGCYQNIQKLYLSHNRVQRISLVKKQRAYQHKTVVVGWYKIKRSMLQLKFVKENNRFLEKPKIEILYYQGAKKGFLTARQRYLSKLPQYMFNSKNCYLMNTKDQSSQYLYEQNRKVWLQQKKCKWRREGYYCLR